MPSWRILLTYRVQMSGSSSNFSSPQVTPGLLLDHTVLTYVLSEFIRSGALASLAATGSVTLTELQVKYPQRQLFLDKATYVLCAAGVLAKGENAYFHGPMFANYWRYAGPIHWLIHGNSRLLLEGPTTSVEEADKLRDYSAIAGSSRLAGEHLIDPFLEPTWAKLVPNCVKRIVDIGCGSAHRLVSLVRAFESLQALGVDRSKEAITIAQNNVLMEGLSERVRLLHADVMQIDRVFHNIDLVFSALMAHDIAPMTNVIAGFQHFGALFPNAKYMLIVDTCRVYVKSDDTTFIEPFEYVHSLLGITLFSVGEWTDTFAAAGWKLNELVKTGLPNTFAFLLSRTEK